jgi:hypothetical protein
VQAGNVYIATKKVSDNISNGVDPRLSLFHIYVACFIIYLGFCEKWSWKASFAFSPNIVQAPYKGAELVL